MTSEASAPPTVGDPGETLGAEAVFTDIYLRKAWVHATADRELYSGPGSNPEFAIPYADAVRAFIQEKGVRRVVDLGCGDFRVGQRIAETGVDYVGVDVVAPVIDYNTAHYASERVRFLHLDMCNAVLPAGDLCLVREVFQHLSNAQIRAALDNTEAFPWRLISDRQARPEDELNPNVDHPSGEGARNALQSALRYDRPPFDRRNVSVFLDVPAATRMMPQSRIRTVLISRPD